MKLSTAIRKGSAQTGQVRSRMCTRDGRTCAIGAALLATGDLRVAQHSGLGNAFMLLGLARTRWPALDMTTGVLWPDTDRLMTLCDIIIILNDNYGVPREEIADWVEWLECGGAL